MTLEFKKRDDVFVRSIGDGTPFLMVVGLALVFSGCFAIFVALQGIFLPHDQLHIGFSAHELSNVKPELTRFMFHNRAAWGGSLIAVGVMWLWLVSFRLREGNLDAWRILLVSGVIGFLSFLAFVCYGYFDRWHGIATLALLPFFIIGIVKARSRLERGSLPSRERRLVFKGLPGVCLWVYAGGLLIAGVAILIISVTVVFVPEDIAFIEMCGADIDVVSARLMPVIAHDRSSFGGALFTLGIMTCMTFRSQRFTRSLWQVVGLSGFAGFGAAVGIHFYVGYTTFTHLAPAYAGFSIFFIGWLTSRQLSGRVAGERAEN